MIRNTKLYGSLFILWLCFSPNTLLSQIVYVNSMAGGTNDGSSWVNAYQDLQTALTNTSTGEIWVAADTYYPNNLTDRAASFELKNNVAIYGGFDGTENLLSERDFNINVTILSGDIANTGISSDNSFHVISGKNVDNTAILDGFTIQDGRADDLTMMINQLGGGILLDGSLADTDLSPIIRNCTFTNNYALAGGGALAAYSGDGGSLAPTIEKCTFLSNQNGALGNGGGIYIQETGTTTGLSNIDVKNCWFENNNAENGGAVFCNTTGSETLNIDICNSLFAKNTATAGGGVFCGNNPAILFTNCTFYDNDATTGPAISGTNLTLAHLNNCIVWGSQSNALIEEVSGGGGSVFIENSVLKGSTLGGSVYNQYPMFVDPENGDYNIHGCSDAVDSGDNLTLGLLCSTDLDNTPRVYGGSVDMGAFEYQGELPEKFGYTNTGISYTLTSSCKVGTWIHYYDLSDPSTFLFSMEEPLGYGNTAPVIAYPRISSSFAPTDPTTGVYLAEDIPNKEALIAMGRYWNVNLIGPTTLNGFVNVRFYFDPQEKAALDMAADTWNATHGGIYKEFYWIKTVGKSYNPNTDLRPTRVDTGLQLAGTEGDTNNGTHYVQFNFISSFSGGTLFARVSGDGAFLPVELASFNATRTDEKRVELEWNVVNEVDNEYFEVQRKLQSEEEFRTIGIVNSLGNTSTPRTYQYSDQNDVSGWSYYRLKIVSTYEDFEYSEVKVVKAQDRLGNIDVFPNPTNSQFHVILPTGLSRNEEMVITVMNTLQQVVYQRQHQLQANDNDRILVEGIGNLPPGVYLVNAQIDGKNYTEKILIKD